MKNEFEIKNYNIENRNLNINIKKTSLKLKFILGLKHTLYNLGRPSSKLNQRTCI